MLKVALAGVFLALAFAAAKAETAESEMAPVCHGCADAKIIARSGIGTSAAQITVLLDWDREERYCKHDSSDGDKIDEKKYKECIDYAKSEFHGPQKVSAHANCATGEFRDFYAKPKNIRFYVGQVKEKAPLLPTIEQEEFYTPIMTHGGFRVPDGGYTNVWEDGDLFRMMCPSSFTSAPNFDYIGKDENQICSDIVGDAEEAKTSYGAAHLLNVNVINEWDIHETGSSAMEEDCEAHVQLNSGDVLIMLYESTIQHGKYIVSSRFLPATR